MSEMKMMKVGVEDYMGKGWREESRLDIKVRVTKTGLKQKGNCETRGKTWIVLRVKSHRTRYFCRNQKESLLIRIKTDTRVLNNELKDKE